MGRVGQTSPDLDYRGRGCAEDEEGGKPWSLSPGKRMHCHSNLALQNGEELRNSVEVAMERVGVTNRQNLGQA